jgi:D-alanyl-D-alanine dipeptidase
VCPDERYVSHPDKGNRNHCRGLAVDITLYDLQTGKEVEMPSGFDEFSEQGNRDYSDCIKEVGERAQLLEEIMKKHVFKLGVTPIIEITKDHLSQVDPNEFDNK